MEAVGEDSASESNQEGDGGVETGTVVDRDSQLIIPIQIQEIWRRSIHSSDAFNQMNALFHFNRRKAEEKQKERDRLTREAKRTRQEQARMQRESEYPSSSFASCDTVGNLGPDLRGCVSFPGAGDSVPVGGWIIGWEVDCSHALIVLCPVTEGSDDYHPVLCPVEFIPRELRAPSKRKTEKKREGKEWQDIDIETYPVKRGNRQLHYLVDGVFEGRTCDDAMLESLRSGLVVTRGKSKPVYGATRLSFAKAERLKPTSAYKLTTEAGSMHLAHPPRGDLLFGERIYQVATAARNNERKSLSSKKSVISHLEEYSAASGIPSKRDICLNVALGGTSSLQEYGRFYPCAVQLQQRQSLQKNSVTTGPCTCDVEIPEECPLAIRLGIQKRYGEGVGHNYKSTAKNNN